MKFQTHLSLQMICAAALLMLWPYSSDCAVQPSNAHAENGTRVSVVREPNGSWTLLVDSQPYFVKGVVYSPVKIGEDPSQGTMRDWTTLDDNHNGRNDMAYDTWLWNDPAQTPIGDFRLMQEMGINTIRLYHEASAN